MTKQFLSLIFVCIFLILGCRTQEEEYVPYVQNEHGAHVQEEYTFHVQEGGEYTAVSPENLCPFTVDIYPDVLHVGDPLYVRLNFRNNTDRDAYVCVRCCDGLVINYTVAEFHLKHSEFIPWSVSSGMGLSGRVTPFWQKFKPGKEGLTQYAVLGFPGKIFGKESLYARSDRTGWWQDIETNGTSGQLVVVINNGARCQVPEVGTDLQSKQLRTVVSVSSPLVIKPREKEEATLLTTFSETTNYGDRDALKRITPKLTPGTLQNFFKYQLLLWDLNDGILDGETKMSEAQVLEVLKKIETFLKPLHEIERENLKRHVDNFPPFFRQGGRRGFEASVNNCGEQSLKRFIEVFGEKPSYPPLPSDYYGPMMGGGSPE